MVGRGMRHLTRHPMVIFPANGAEASATKVPVALQVGLVRFEGSFPTPFLNLSSSIHLPFFRTWVRKRAQSSLTSLRQHPVLVSINHSSRSERVPRDDASVDLT